MRPRTTSELRELADNCYLQLGDEQLYNEIMMCLTGPAVDTSVITNYYVRAEQVIAFTEYKEYIVSLFMKVTDVGLKLWGSKTGVATESLYESMKTRLSEDDDLLIRMYEFSDILKNFPFLSWTVDNVRMFIVNYFIKQPSV
jgi:hypothetical protein